MHAGLLALYTFQERLTGHSMGLMSYNMVVAYINKQEGTISSSPYLLARRVLAWAESMDLSGPLYPRSTKCDTVPTEASKSGYRHSVISPSPSGTENLPIVGDTSNRLAHQLWTTNFRCIAFFFLTQWLGRKMHLIPWDNLGAYAFPPFSQEGC